MISKEFVLHFAAAAIALGLMSGCAVPGSEKAGSGAVGTPLPSSAEPSPSSAAVSSPVPSLEPTSAARAAAARLYSQDEVTALAGAITGPDGSPARVLGDDEFSEQNLDVHFRVLQAEVSPQECANQLGWSTLTAEGIPAAGSYIALKDHVAFVAMSADREDMLSQTFNATARLEDCSPLTITLGGQSATATYRRVTAYTDADVTHGIIASLAPPSGAARHQMRVAAKSGTLFILATANIDSPDDFRAESDRLSGLINQVLAAQARLTPTA